MAKLWKIDGKWTKDYLKATGQKPPGSLVTDQDFKRMNAAANDAQTLQQPVPQQPAAPSTFTDPTQAVKRVVDAVGTAKATGTSVSGMTTEQARGLVDQGLGAGLAQDANKPKQEPAADVSGVPAVPVQPEQPMTFVDFLKSLGIGVPQTPQFSFDPQAAYNAALAEAELAIGPQREALQFNTNRRIADTRARGEARVKSLKESQAQRRMFGSPAGLTAENMLQDETEQAIRGAESERDMRLSGLEQQKALRALTGAQRMERDAYSDYARALSSTQRQFNSLVGLWDKAADNARADKKQQAEIAKWLGTLEIQRMNAETSAAYKAGQLAQGEAKIAQGDARLALDEAKLVVKVEQDAAKLMQGWAKIRSANLAKFGIRAGDLYNKALDAAMEGDAEKAEQFLEQAASAYDAAQDEKEGRKDARTEQTALMSTFRSMASKYGPQVAAYVAAGLQATTPEQQAQWFGLAETAIQASLQAESDRILGRQLTVQEARAMAAAERQAAQQAFQTAQAAARAAETNRRSYTLKFGPNAATILVQADMAETEGNGPLAAALRIQAMDVAREFMAKPESVTQQTQAWRNAYSEIDRVAKDFEISPAQARQMAVTIAAKWTPHLTPQEQGLLAALIEARFPASKTPSTNRHNN